MEYTSTPSKRKVSRVVTEGDVAKLQQILVETSADQVTVAANTEKGLTAGTVQQKLEDLSSSIVSAGKVDDVKVNGTTIVSNKVADLAVDGTYVASGENANKIATKSTVTSEVSTHNSDTTAHSDIRGLISDNTDDINDIQDLIPTQATTTNKLADKDFVNSSIQNMAAFYVTTRTGEEGSYEYVPFATKADLLSTTTKIYIDKTEVTKVGKNDYCIVLADESKKETSAASAPTTRYIYTKTSQDNYDPTAWEFQYIVNNTGLTEAQVKALNSGITSEIVSTIVPNTTTVNGKALSSNITLNLDDVGDGTTRKLTMVEASTTNGNIKINGTETTVYTLPNDVLNKTTADGYYVAKVDGKGLSTNDYDNDAKAEVAKIANKADAVSITEGTYTCTHVNSQGIVTGGGQMIAYDTTGLEKLCIGGLYFEEQS